MLMRTLPFVAHQTILYQRVKCDKLDSAQETCVYHVDFYLLVNGSFEGTFIQETNQACA